MYFQSERHDAFEYNKMRCNYKTEKRKKKTNILALQIRHYQLNTSKEIHFEISYNLHINRSILDI